jgi:hypothetical protein
VKNVGEQCAGGSDTVSLTVEGDIDLLLMREDPDARR